MSYDHNGLTPTMNKTLDRLEHHGGRMRYDRAYIDTRTLNCLSKLGYICYEGLDIVVVKRRK